MSKHLVISSIIATVTFWALVAVLHRRHEREMSKPIPYTQKNMLELKAGPRR